MINYKGMTPAEIMEEKMTWANSLPEVQRDKWNDFYYRYFRCDSTFKQLEYLSANGTLKGF